MQRFWLGLFIPLLFAIRSLVAEESFDPFSSSLTNTQNLLPTAVQSVSTISGEWLYSETDFTLTGPAPIILSRAYSADYSKDILGYNWDFNRPHQLVLTHDSKYKARFHHPTGIKTIHKGDKFENGILHLPLSHTRSLTNCRSSEISARTNLHNTILKINLEEEHCTALAGSGHVTFFTLRKKNHRGHKHFSPLFERETNGNQIVYEPHHIFAYDDKKRTCFGWVKIKSNGQELLEVHASDGSSGEYRFNCYEEKEKINFDNNYLGKYKKGKKHKKKHHHSERKKKTHLKKYCLVQAKFSHKPTKHYEYEHPDLNQAFVHPPNPLLKKVIWPNGRFQSVEYYQTGKNHIDQLNTIKLASKDFRVNRVKEIKAPVGHDQTPIITHRLIYLSDDKSAKSGEAFSGTTEVYDAYMRKTAYSYNKEHRPKTITRFLNGSIYSEEHFVWNENKKELHPLHPIRLLKKLHKKRKNEFLTDTEDNFSYHTAEIFFTVQNNELKTLRPSKKLLQILFKPHKNESQVGNLLGKYKKDELGKILHALFFNYDTRGNISEETFYGNLSGQKNYSIELDDDEYPKENGIEFYKKYFNHSDDAFNLILSEKEDNGKGILYEYVPDKDLISAKYITEQDNIRFRQFFFYDENATLIKVIKDDGSELDCNDLKNVHERQLTFFTPRQEIPYGLPEVIEEKYWDFDTKNEVLLKKIICDYTKEGYLTKQEHYNSHNQYCYSLSWEYDAHGNITKEINALGQQFLKKYDENDNLIFYQGPRETILHTYDYANRLISSERTADGQVFITQHSYDFVGNRVSTIDPFGQKTNFFYDDFNRLVKTELPKILLSENEPTVPVMEMSYDANDLPTTHTQPGGWTTYVSYNARGKPTTTIHANGTTEQNIYHLDGTLAATIAPNGTKTQYLRDFLGRVLAEETYDIQNHLLTRITFVYQGTKLISKTDAEGATIHYDYDGAGRLISESENDFYKTYAYDSLSRIAKITQWYGHKKEETSIQAFEYDFLNRITEERLEDGMGNNLQRVWYTYDDLGNQTHTWRETQSGTSFTYIEYNANSQPTKIIDPDGNPTYFSYDYKHKNSLIQQVLKIEKINSQGKKTIQIFDALGREVEVVERDALGRLLSYHNSYYDPLGRKIKSVDYIIVNGIEKRRLINTWRYYYNEAEEDLFTEAVGTPQQRMTHYFYNAFGQREKIVKPDGVEIYQTYDALGRLQKIQSSDKTIDDHYTYNRCHQVTEVQDHLHNCKTLRNYDPNGNLLQEKLANGISVSYAYDRMGRVIELYLPGQTTMKYLYNAAYLKEIQRYKNGQLQYQHQNLTHDLTGTLTRSQLIGEAGTIDYKHDRSGRMVEINHTHWKQHNKYDSLGRLSENTTLDSLGSYPSSFSYNEINQLQKEQGYTSHTYQMDSIHNRLQKNDIACSLNNLNQLIEHNQYHYQYDTNGNLIKKIQNHQTIEYSYDAFNRLIRVNTPQGNTSYQYDAFNRRIVKNHQGNISKYIYQGNNEIGVIDQNGIMTECRLLGIGINADIGAVVAIELYGRTFAPIHDRQGNITCLIDAATGRPIETYRYSAFGEETIFNEQGQTVSESQVGNQWRFASKRKDPETQWIFFGGRYYEPETGRWTTPDPIGAADGPNLYAYLHHNPLNQVDASGYRGEAMRDFCKPEFSRDYFPNYLQESSSSMFSTNPDRTPHHEERAEYINNSYKTTAKNILGGTLRGGANFIAHQFSDMCMIGSQEWEDSFEDRLSFQAAFSSWQNEQLGTFDHLVEDYIGCDTTNSAYQKTAAMTTIGLEIIALARGSFSGVKGIGRAFKASRAFTRGTKIVGKVARTEIKSVASTFKNSPVDLVIKETLESKGMITSRYRLSSNEVLEAGEKFIGENYREIARGVFRSNDGLRIFRIDNSSLIGLHRPKVPHFHLEAFSQIDTKPYINNHILFYE